MAAVSAAGDAAAPASLSGWFQRRPVLLFVIVTFLVSYGLGFPALFMIGTWGSDLNDVAELYVGRFFGVGEELGWRGWLLPNLTAR